ncbi:MAG: hypothetical protein PUH99_03300 [Firmicutes bacterium]|nr:hypothetical protein [Bacillota bacterium]MDY5531774.1 hypothetical protein [Pumilibacteraceae bacterium]
MTEGVCKAPRAILSSRLCKLIHNKLKKKNVSPELNKHICKEAIKRKKTILTSKTILILLLFIMLSSLSDCTLPLKEAKNKIFNEINQIEKNADYAINNNFFSDFFTIYPLYL